MKISKRILTVALIVAGLAGAAAAVWAQAQDGRRPGQGRGMTMMRGQMGDGGMCGMMLGRTQLLATNDGGVVVMLGNKLYKYDRELKLTREAELKIDAEAMQRLQRQMQNACPMMQPASGTPTPSQ